MSWHMVETHNPPTPPPEQATPVAHEGRGPGKFTKVRSIAIYGGVNKKPQVNALRSSSPAPVACRTTLETPVSIFQRS